MSLLTLGGLRLLFNTALKPEFAGAELVYSMRPLMSHPEARVLRQIDIRDAVEKPPASIAELIRRRGVLRVGVLPNRLPYVFVDRGGQLVGFDVEMAQLFARDLGAKVELVELEDFAELPPLLASGRIDIAMAGIAVTPERARTMLFSEAYLDETLAFVVKDHLRDRFSTWPTIRTLGTYRVAVPNLPYYIDHLSTRAPTLNLEPVDTMSQIETNLRRETFDAVMMPAESGSVLTLLYPKFTVVVPEPGIIKIPLAYPVARRDQEWAQLINTWIELKRRDGTIDALYNHWILGKQADKREPRWSIMRNVLHWAD